jgi:hypothetical protein
MWENFQTMPKRGPSPLPAARLPKPNSHQKMEHVMPIIRLIAGCGMAIMAFILPLLAYSGP